MATEPSLESRKDRLELAADGLVITSALFSVLTAAAIAVFVLPGPTGPGGRDQGMLVGLVSLALSFAGMVTGPVLAWLLHRRRLTLAAVFGGVVGASVSGTVAGLGLVVFGSLVSWIARAAGGNEVTGAIVLLALVGAVFAAVILWTVVDAVRDLAPSRRRHARLDTARIVAALVIVAFGVGVTYGATRPGEGEMAEAFIFAIGAGIFGAGAAFGATMGERILKKGLYEPASEAMAMPPAEAPAPDAPEPTKAAE